MTLAVVTTGFIAGAILIGLRPSRATWTKYVVYIFVVAAVLGAAQLGTRALQALVAAIAVLGAFELHGVLPASGRLAYRVSVWTTYLAIVALAEAVLQVLPPQRAAYLYLIVAVFDAFSQVIGQLLGVRKLVPKLSPGKTIAGLVGGGAAALVAAVLLRDLAGVGMLQAVLRALAICAVALGGDLSASWLKRRAGIKDYGRILPGHGGILDRFDGVLPALALCGPLFL
jgi:phosphatidate cytidylyltransferase